MEIQSWEECDEALRKLAVADLTLKKAQVLRDREVLHAQTRYSTTTSDVVEEREDLAKQVEAWAKAHKREIEAAGRKSTELNFGVIGWRKSSGVLAVRKGWKMPDVMATLREMFQGQALLDSLIRVKQTLNKDLVKGTLTADQLDQAGLRVSAPERFFIETFPEKLEP